MKLKASDGTVFGAFRRNGGDYIAAQDSSGTHYAPAQHEVLPVWSEAERLERIENAVAEYERERMERIRWLDREHHRNSN